MGAEDAERVLDALFRRWADGIIHLMEVADHADTQAFGALVQIGREVRHRAIGAGRIERIVARHRLQQQGAILHRPGHRAGMVQRLRQRQHAAAAGQSVGRLDPGEPHKRRRAADRAAGIRAGAAQHQPGRDRRAGAGGRSGGEMGRVPRIARRRPGQIERGATDRELMRGELAHQNGSGVGPFADHDRIFSPGRYAPATSNGRWCGYRRCCKCPCVRSGCRRAVLFVLADIIRASAALASAMARSSVTSRKLCSVGSRLLMRSRQIRVSSTGESCFAAISFAASAMVRNASITSPQGRR